MGMPTPIEFLETQARATRQLIQSLSDADMAAPSPGCPGWTVKDIVVHLTSGGQMFNGLAKGELDGAQWMEERQRRMAANSALSPSELRASFAEADETLVGTFKGLTPEQLQGKRRHPALGEIPVQQLAGMRTSETAVHAWDIQVALDAGAKFASPALPGVLPAVVAALPLWFLPDKIAGMERSYRFLVGEPMNHDHTLRIAGGKAAWVEDGAGGNVTLQLDAGDFLLMLTGRLSSQQLIDAGRAQVSDDRAAAAELSSLFKAYAGR